MRSPAKTWIEAKDCPGEAFGQPGLIERRLRFRFPIELPVRFRTLGKRYPVAGMGRVVNISSGGVLVAYQNEISAGTPVEMNIDWPTRLDGRVPLNLVAVGRVLRSERFSFAVGLERYHFRIARRTDLPAGESYGPRGRQRQASA